MLAPSAPQPATVEWTMIRPAAEPDLTRAPRQRDLFETLKERGGASTTSALLSETGASRNSPAGARAQGRSKARAPPGAGALAGPPSAILASPNASPRSCGPRGAPLSAAALLVEDDRERGARRSCGHSEGDAGGWETGPGTGP